jgi:hypothetical protein
MRNESADPNAHASWWAWLSTIAPVRVPEARAKQSPPPQPKRRDHASSDGESS